MRVQGSKKSIYGVYIVLKEYTLLKRVYFFDEHNVFCGVRKEYYCYRKSILFYKEYTKKKEMSILQSIFRVRRSILKR